MGLVGFEVDQTWGSHQPVLMALMEVVCPQSVMECGSGHFSTPVLQAAPHLHTVEHDPRWAKEVIQAHPSPPSHRWTIQGFQGAKNSVAAEDLSPETLVLINHFYRDLAVEQGAFDLLFVDTFRACRTIAAKALAPQAQIVVIHDIEPQSEEYYRWYLMGDLFQDWEHSALHRPSLMIRKRYQVPWTGVLSRNPLPVKLMNQVVARESVRLWGEETQLEVDDD